MRFPLIGARGALVTHMTLAALSAAFTLPAIAQQGAAIVGKNDWLFYRIDLTDPSEQPAIDSSLDLIRRSSALFEANGTRVVVAVVPIKVRVHAEHLPDSVKLTPFLNDNYGKIVAALKKGGVHVADLNTPFLAAVKRGGDELPFMRLDSHWSQPGAQLAAQTIRQTIDADPVLAKALAETPEQAFSLVWNADKVTLPPGDLTTILPPGTPRPPAEQVRTFTVTRAGGDSNLLGDASTGVALIGSSYTGAWTGFPDALRAALQRDLPALVMPADRGQWVGMEAYLRDDAFQKQRPKLIVWEIPERALAASPSYRWRDPRYVLPDREWWLRAAALIDTACAATPTTLRVEATGLAAGKAPDGGALQAAATTAADFVELRLDPSGDGVDYLSAQLKATGSQQITIETSGAGVPARRTQLAFAGSDGAHALKFPIHGDGKKINRVRIYPGKSSGFAIDGVRLCRMPGVGS